MKGIVFNLLNEMVEERFGLAAWDALLTETRLDGIYVASATYPDAELMALVAAASDATEIPTALLVHAFGEYMAPKFAERYPVFFDGHRCLKSFLLTVDEVVHVEVRKLYPEANLPEFRYEDRGDNSLTMIYRSPRKLCGLAEGLIAGSAKHFGQRYTLRHDVCMHRGSDHCVLELTLLPD
ncbi:MAG: heme NO-binding domain-containing protein [Pseudomonadota bacterium]